jgi:hypothetical protein
MIARISRTIPVTLMLTAFLAAAAFNACADQNAKGKADTMSPTSKFLTQEIFPQDYYSEVDPDPDAQGFSASPEIKPVLLWIQSDRGWRRAGYKTPLPLSAAPDEREKNSREPDFAQWDALYLNLGLQGTTGDTVHVEKVDTQGNVIRVSALHTVATEAQGEAMTWVKAMVRVPKLPHGGKVFLTINGKDSDFELKILD